jgi:hypothetical protein
MGPPPAGRQLIADRGASLAMMVPPNGDGLLRILLTRPGDATDLLDLSVVSLDADDHVSPEIPLVSNIDAVFGVGCDVSVAPKCSLDASGRVEVQVRGMGTAWVDPVTGEIEYINSFAPQHPLGKRSFIYESPTTGTLYDADGKATPITYATPDPRAYGPPEQLVGDDFYYRDPQNNLIEISPSDVPQQLAHDVISFQVWTTPGGPLLALTRATADPDVLRSSVLDPSTAMETALPLPATGTSISPDGRWVVQTTAEFDSSSYTAVSSSELFFELGTGRQDVLQFDGRSGVTWRPGTSQAWIGALDADHTPVTWIWQPDAPALSLPGIPFKSFTPDGAYWFSEGPTSSPIAATEVVEIGAADDPTGPRYPLNPPSTYPGQWWQLPDGRFLNAYAFNYDANRSDVTLVDPRTGDTQPFGHRGFIAGMGQSRVLGIFNVDESRGNLKALALDTGATTALAPEFAVMAFAEPQGTDPLAPGTRVVYQFQARTASPYDGIWVTPCP